MVEVATAPTGSREADQSAEDMEFEQLWRHAEYEALLIKHEEEQHDGV